MKKKYLLIFIMALIVLNQASFAGQYFGEFKGCGRYILAGIVRKNHTNLVVIIVNEGTNSEFVFTAKEGEKGNYIGHIDLPFSTEVSIIKIDGTKGVLSNPINSKRIYPNPIDPRTNSGFIQLTKSECLK